MPSAADTRSLDATEHQVFWMLVKKAARRDDVARAYLAIQAALAYQQEAVNVGWLTGMMMPDGQPSPPAGGEAIGASGLAYFHWLFQVDLHAAGDADEHHHRFVRRADGAQTVALLRTAAAPRSLQFQQEYERQRRRLAEKRETFLAALRKGRPASLPA